MLEIVETSEPGVYILWALVGEELHKLKLEIPRIFLVNQKEPKETDVGFRLCLRMVMIVEKNDSYILEDIAE